MNKERRIKNASKNVLSAFINKFCILILTFIGRKFFIQYIGVEYLGINGLFSNVLTLLSLADLGLGTAMNVSLYKPIAEENHAKIAALLQYYRKIYYLITATVLILGLGLMPFLKYIINMERNIPYLYLYYVVFVIRNASSYMFAYKASIIKADQRMYLVNRIEVFVIFTRNILQIVLIIWTHSYLLYLLMDVVQHLVHNIILACIANKYYPFVNEKHDLTPKEKKTLFQNVSSMFIYRVSWTLLNGTDNILISIMLGTVCVGLYSNYLTITSNIETFIALLFVSITSSVGNLIATAPIERRYQVFKLMQMISFWLCGIVTVCLIFLTQDFIQLYFGKDLLLDNLTLIAIVLNTYFNICMRPVWTFREGCGMYQRIKYIMFVTAVLNLVLSVVLGKYLGLSGILFATSISKLLTYFWYEPSVLFKDFFHQKNKKYYICHAYNLIVMGISIISIYWICSLFRTTGIWLWFTKAFICIICVNTIYYVQYRKTDEFREFVNILRHYKNH